MNERKRSNKQFKGRQNNDKSKSSSKIGQFLKRIESKASQMQCTIDCSDYQTPNEDSQKHFQKEKLKTSEKQPYSNSAILSARFREASREQFQKDQLTERVHLKTDENETPDKDLILIQSDSKDMLNPRRKRNIQRNISMKSKLNQLTLPMNRSNSSAVCNGVQSERQHTPAGHHRVGSVDKSTGELRPWSKDSIKKLDSLFRDKSIARELATDVLSSASLFSPKNPIFSSIDHQKLWGNMEDPLSPGNLAGLSRASNNRKDHSNSSRKRPYLNQSHSQTQVRAQTSQSNAYNHSALNEDLKLSLTLKSNEISILKEGLAKQRELTDEAQKEASKLKRDIEVLRFDLSQISQKYSYYKNLSILKNGEIERLKTVYESTNNLSLSTKKDSVSFHLNAEDTDQLERERERERDKAPRSELLYSQPRERECRESQDLIINLNRLMTLVVKDEGIDEVTLKALDRVREGLEQRAGGARGGRKEGGQRGGKRGWDYESFERSHGKTLSRDALLHSELMCVSIGQEEFSTLKTVTAGLCQGLISALRDIESIDISREVIENKLNYQAEKLKELREENRRLQLDSLEPNLDSSQFEQNDSIHKTKSQRSINKRKKNHSTSVVSSNQEATPPKPSTSSNHNVLNSSNILKVSGTHKNDQDKIHHPTLSSLFSANEKAHPKSTRPQAEKPHPRSQISNLNSNLTSLNYTLNELPNNSRPLRPAKAPLPSDPKKSLLGPLQMDVPSQNTSSEEALKEGEPMRVDSPTRLAKVRELNKSLQSIQDGYVGDIELGLYNNSNYLNLLYK